ncbi:MAG: hypothetical protein AAB853_02185 [Patescibacteria group bacterium]
MFPRFQDPVPARATSAIVRTTSTCFPSRTFPITACAGTAILRAALAGLRCSAHAVAAAAGAVAAGGACFRACANSIAAPGRWPFAETLRTTFTRGAQGESRLPALFPRVSRAVSAQTASAASAAAGAEVADLAGEAQVQVRFSAFLTRIDRLIAARNEPAAFTGESVTGESCLARKSGFSAILTRLDGSVPADAFPDAAGRTAITAQEIAIIALLARFDDAVPANGTSIAVARGTPITADTIPIIAFLACSEDIRALNDAVAAVHPAGGHVLCALAIDRAADIFPGDEPFALECTICV